MNTYEQLVNLSSRRSIFYPASEIYTTTPAGFWSYGPYGVSIRQKLLNLWRQHFVKHDNMLEIDAAQIMPADVFKASGHLAKFTDPITNCTKCKSVYRADKLLTEKTHHAYKEAQTNEELTSALRSHAITCPACKGQLQDVTRSSLMVQAIIGTGRGTECYLRPESCQSIFTDYLRMTKTMRVKLPFGMAQYGKMFRNEISPRQTLLRQMEIYVAEIEVFFDPKKINSFDEFETVKKYPINIQLNGTEKITPIPASELVTKKIVSGNLLAYYLARTQQFFEKLGIPTKTMRFRQLADDERAFYAKEAFDFEVETSLGWIELAANNYRTDYDLKVHSEGSKKDLHFTEPDGTKILPHVWEISIGFDRTFLVMLEHALRTEKERTYFSLPPTLAPTTAGILPLLSNKPELVSKSQEVYKLLQDFDVFYDDTGSIGKRYARLDEIGAPYCITIDFDSLVNNDVTLRHRDSTKQERVNITELKEKLAELMKN